MNDFSGTFKEGTKVHQVFLVLQDQKWHCRECEYTHVSISQIAGGSGIQGLQRGTKSRAGMKIKSKLRSCGSCNKKTTQDRWTGDLVPAIPASSIPSKFAKRVQRVIGLRDVVELTRRAPSELTIDHKLPSIRWNTATWHTQTNYSEMSDQEIRDRFQMLKSSNGSVSHNLLKSRACEVCFETGQRGTPFGIVFFYKGSIIWSPEDIYDPEGCVGCGWYDFAKWRKELNLRLAVQSAEKQPEVQLSDDQAVEVTIRR